MATKKSKILSVTAAIILLSFMGGTYLFLKPENDYKSILIGGSSTVHQYTLALAEEFMRNNNGTSIYCETGGSTPGLLAVKNEAIDIAAMSRDLKEEEDDEYIKNYLIGKDGVGIVVHPSNPLANLTIDQVKGIFSGEIDNWSSLGGSDSEIIVIGRNSDSTTYKALNEIVMKGSGFTDYILCSDSPEQMREAVASNPDSVGFLALKDMDGTVKALDINGVRISRETILTDRYPISRSFYFVVYDKPDNTVKNNNLSNPIDMILSLFKSDSDTAHRVKTDTLLRFLDFVESSKGQEIIEKHGAIAVH